MNTCPLIARIFGCKFQPRFDTQWSDRLVKIDTYRGDMAELKDKTYVHDICARCGKIVQRSAS